MITFALSFPLSPCSVIHLNNPKRSPLGLFPPHFCTLNQFEAAWQLDNIYLNCEDASTPLGAPKILPFTIKGI